METKGEKLKCLLDKTVAAFDNIVSHKQISYAENVMYFFAWL